MSAPEIAGPAWLLVKTCKDVLTKSQSPEHYDKLRMAGLLRHVLVGSHALAERATAGEEPLVFWFREPPEDRPWTSAEGFDASRRQAAHGEVRKVGRSELLAARVAFFGQWYTVAQLLAAIEHFYGGAPSTGLEGVSRESMMALDQAVRTRPNVVAVALQEIAGVTLRALIPFAEKHQPKGERPEPKPAMAPAGSACPFAGKISLD